MEKLADKIASYIFQQNQFSKEDYSIYKYGMQVGMETITCLTIAAIISIYLDSFVGFLTFIIVFFPLRSCVGGIHLKHFYSCCVCSCLLISCILILSKTAKPPQYILIMIAVGCLGAINKLAPLTTKESVSDESEMMHLAHVRQRILVLILAVTIVVRGLGLIEYLALITYTLVVVLSSMFLEITKAKKIKFIQ